MKLYRYMGKEEFALLTSGATLKNTKNWCRSQNSNSVGFCFLPETTNFVVFDTVSNEYKKFAYDPDMCIEFLSGLVDNTYLVEFEVIDATNLKKGTGVYADPTYLSGYDGLIRIEEYSVQEYSSKTLMPLRYGYVYEDCKTPTEWYDCVLY